MKIFFQNFYYSFPVQLFLLHFRKAEILLIFWLILFLTITGHFLQLFGADALFLAPEYLGKVSALSSAITGIATGVFFMSWNITTFILHSQRFRFLATNSKPFFKYCINNSIIPIAFLLVYFFKAMWFDINMELISVFEFITIVAGFSGGLLLLLLVSFAYFFTADRRIVRTFTPVLSAFDKQKKYNIHKGAYAENDFGLPVGYYLTTRFRFIKARKVGHYSRDFIDKIFNHHHLSAIITFLLAFIFMVVIGFYLDNKIFQVPAAASILIFFALLVAVIGALTYFLRSWSGPFVVLLFIILNILYVYNIIDPRNKAFGLNYTNNVRPDYSLQNLESLNTTANIQNDKKNMLSILERWKQKQGEVKPVMIIFNFSGGGVRSAAFAMNILEELDSITKGSIMKNTFLISGASGGMLAAAYFRELARLKDNGENINLQDKNYVDDISQDILNPVFSSMIARDVFSPIQKFKVGKYSYTKDRGYAFEEKLNYNTHKILDKNIGFYKADESNAAIPLMILNSVITKDLRKLMICTQPLSFMMQSTFTDSTSALTGPDAVDFTALFKNEDPMNLRFLTALRMNATYPYVLPNVWLPTNPIIDVMDAGLRDNFGQETSLRFVEVFKEWLKENTSKVVLLQIRDRSLGDWEKPFEGNSLISLMTKPFLILQNNWYKLQDYYQHDALDYMFEAYGPQFHRICFQYVPSKKEAPASLSFHLTAAEKRDIAQAFDNPANKEQFEKLKQIMR